MQPRVRGRDMGAIATQTGDLVLNPEFLALQARQDRLIREWSMKLVIDLLLKMGMLAAEALHVVVHGHPLPSSG
jgi:hypothetical protein